MATDINMNESRIKQLALITAIVLPIVLILVIWLLSSSHTIKVPPKYDFMYSVNQDWQAKLESIDNQIVLKYRYQNKEAKNSAIMPSLYRYYVASNESVEMKYPAPKDLVVSSEWQTVPIMTLDKDQFIAGKKAPDGYQYESRYHGGLGDGIFSQRTPNHMIKRKGDVIIFSRERDHVDFIGWIKPKGAVDAR